MSIPKDRNMIMREPWKFTATLLFHCRRKVEASSSLFFALRRLHKELPAFTELHFFHKHFFPPFTKIIDEYKDVLSLPLGFRNNGANTYMSGRVAQLNVKRSSQSANDAVQPKERAEPYICSSSRLFQRPVWRNEIQNAQRKPHGEHTGIRARPNINVVLLLAKLVFHIPLSGFRSPKIRKPACMSRSGSPPTNRTGFIHMFRTNFSQSFEKKEDILNVRASKSKTDFARCIHLENSARRWYGSPSGSILTRQLVSRTSIEDIFASWVHPSADYKSCSFDRLPSHFYPTLPLPRSKMAAILRDVCAWSRPPKVTSKN